jgi:uncharacterized membrane-anchored protein YjiN (DUF445 family)
MKTTISIPALIESLGLTTLEFLEDLFTDYDDYGKFVKMISENEEYKEGFIDVLVSNSIMSTRLKEEFKSDFKEEMEEDVRDEIKEEIEAKIEDRLRSELSEDENFIIESIQEFNDPKKVKILKEAGLLPLLKTMYF